MRCLKSVCCGMMLLGWVTSAKATDAAADSFGKEASTKESAKPAAARQRAIAEFDTDGDGKLSTAERRAARMALAKKKRAAQATEGEGQSSGSTSLAGNNSGFSSGGGMNPYSNGATGYGTMNPYSLGSPASGYYYYYSTGVFNQLTPGQTGMGAGMSGGCMSGGSSGSGGGRR